MRISDWSSDVCSSDLRRARRRRRGGERRARRALYARRRRHPARDADVVEHLVGRGRRRADVGARRAGLGGGLVERKAALARVARPDADTRHADERALLFLRSEEHTSDLQSLMRISYAVFCLKKKKTNKN